MLHIGMELGDDCFSGNEEDESDTYTSQYGALKSLHDMAYYK